MKTLLISVTIIINSILCNSLFSQTIEMEVDNLSNKFKNGEFDASQYQKIAKVWRKSLEDIGGYPILPYNNELHDVHYEFVFTFDSLDKSIIYNRILEWTSLQNSSLSDVLDYQDYDLGKIISKNRNQIRKYSSSRYYYLSTSRFTIIDYKLKVEIFKLSYDHEFDSYSYDDATFYNYVINYPITKFYPITNLDRGSWEEKMKLLKETDTDIKSNIDKLVQFIRDVNKDYDF